MKRKQVFWTNPKVDFLTFHVRFVQIGGKSLATAYCFCQSALLCQTTFLEAPDRCWEHLWYSLQLAKTLCRRQPKRLPSCEFFLTLHLNIDVSTDFDITQFLLCKEL